ncbi:Crp/Fnr family transcriptional regulator [Novosphingobium terrae]|uniref:Crp/Fnr family transcriptional regulator n=1 Tax=Novosphingobium terrae TaxID=2726189 RepID=UPI0019810704|nr:Crp/Fnr family transcriptional regulator [Novosphingobium terrae]
MTGPKGFPLSPFLYRLTRHSPLSDEECRIILGWPSLLDRIGANRDFPRPGEPSDYALLVVDGLVARFCQSGGGARQITALYLPGEIANLEGITHPDACRLEALSPTVTRKIPHDAIRSAARACGALSEALWRECTIAAAIQAQWLTNLGRRDAKSRMAHLLAEMDYRVVGKPCAGHFKFPFPATQTHLADFTGLTSIHVNRVLQSLRHDGIAHFSHREVHVLDWKRLVATGGFDATYLAQP